MAEFAPVLFVFFMIILFPLINLIGVGTGVATVALITSQAASMAGDSATLGDALTAMENTSTNLASSGFGKFAHLKAVGGSNNTGCDLYVVVTDISNNAAYSFGPNTSFPNPVDDTQCLYEYRVRSTFDVGPFLNLSGVPGFGGVPGLGVPARIAWSNEKNVEHPEGIIVGGTGPKYVPPPPGGPPPPKSSLFAGGQSE